MGEQNVISTNWTAEQDAFLKENYRSLSAKAIANVLGRTKNSVISRAQRVGLGLSYDKVFRQGNPPKQYTKRKRGNPKAHPTGSQIFYRRTRVMSSEKIVEANIQPLNGVGVKMWDLVDKHCRWVMGEPKDLTFCGHDHHAGSKYCSTHHSLSIRSSK